MHLLPVGCARACQPIWQSHMHAAEFRTDLCPDTLCERGKGSVGVARMATAAAGGSSGKVAAATSPPAPAEGDRSPPASPRSR